MNSEFDDIFSIQNTEVEKEEPPKGFLGLDLKNDKVLRLQVILLVIWFVLTFIIYFFGYPLFESFIDV
jgi:hypothetical protein